MLLGLLLVVDSLFLTILFQLITDNILTIISSHIELQAYSPDSMTYISEFENLPIAARGDDHSTFYKHASLKRFFAARNGGLGCRSCR